ncbi:MAG: hypothetical protein ACFCU4_04570 [Puniceicoccaceae bacterium]
MATADNAASSLRSGILSPAVPHFKRSAKNMNILIDDSVHTFESIDSLETHLREKERDWEILEFQPKENQIYGFQITMVAEADDGFAYSINYFPREEVGTRFFLFDDFDTTNFDWAFGIFKEFCVDQEATISRYKWEEISLKVSFRNILYIVGCFVFLLIIFMLLNKN